VRGNVRGNDENVSLGTYCADTVPGLMTGSSRPTTTGFPNPMTVNDPACPGVTGAGHIASARANMPPPEKRMMTGI